MRGLFFGTLADVNQMSNAKHYSALSQDWHLPMEVGGIAAILVSITVHFEPVEIPW
jgi:hypothetical protein